jgi:hypothetical protein
MPIAISNFFEAEGLDRSDYARHWILNFKKLVNVASCVAFSFAGCRPPPGLLALPVLSKLLDMHGATPLRMP